MTPDHGAYIAATTGCACVKARRSRPRSGLAFTRATPSYAWGWVVTAMFLSPVELAVLTGRKVKSKQVEALRKMGVPFFVNACGRAVVARAAIEGSARAAVRPENRARGAWNPSVLGG